MADDLTLRVITPDQIVLDARASSIKVPAANGSMGILPRHAHLVAALDIGLLSFKNSEGEHQLFVSGGFVEVRDNTVRVVSEAGERPEAIDEERAREAEMRARKHIDEGHQLGGSIDILRAEAALRRARFRLLAKRGYARTLT